MHLPPDPSVIYDFPNEQSVSLGTEDFPDSAVQICLLPRITSASMIGWQVSLSVHVKQSHQLTSVRNDMVNLVYTGCLTISDLEGFSSICVHQLLRVIDLYGPVAYCSTPLGITYSLLCCLSLFSWTVQFAGT